MRIKVLPATLVLLFFVVPVQAKQSWYWTRTVWSNSSGFSLVVYGEVNLQHARQLLINVKEVSKVSLVRGGSSGQMLRIDVSIHQRNQMSRVHSRVLKALDRYEYVPDLSTGGKAFTSPAFRLDIPQYIS